MLKRLNIVPFGGVPILPAKNIIPINGRIARLLANLPLLKAGLPPLVIPQVQRREYIQILAKYQISVGQLNAASGVWPDIRQLHDFEYFCATIYSITKSLVEKAHVLQAKRNG